MERRLPLPTGTVLQGRYRIVRQLGHGGFGAVYEAIDDEINLSFALKETFYAADEDWRQAFKREARMLASLSHDAFPRVTHYFTEGDGCFLVMELIHGDDLDKLLSQRSRPFEQEKTLIWADQLLDALVDLHAKGIIHRDIKPSNLKITSKGKIKLLDFGIAKGAIENETTMMKTAGSLAAATLQYAPLEQVLKSSEQYQMMLSVVSSGKVAEIKAQGTDPSSDLYSLAATLYHLMTKRLPADAPTRALALWTDKPDPLIPAHQINPQVSKELSEFFNKALHLDKRDRVRSASEMRQLLQTVSADNSINAKEQIPETAKLSHPDAEIENLTLKPTEASPAMYIVSPRAPTAKNKKGASVGIGFGLLLLLLVIGVIGFFYINSRLSDEKINTAGSNANAEISNKKYELTQTLTGHHEIINSIAFSPDSKTLVSSGNYDAIKLWDAESGTLKQTITAYTGSMRTVAFSPDGKILVGADYGTIKLWDASSGALKQTITEYTGSLLRIAFSPDGKILAGGDDKGTIKLWDVSSGALKQTITEYTGSVYSIAFSPDGKMLASGSYNSTIKLWDVSSGTLKQIITEYTGSVWAVVFSPDGKILAAGGSDKTIKLWQMKE